MQTEMVRKSSEFPIRKKARLSARFWVDQISMITGRIMGLRLVVLNR